MSSLQRRLINRRLPVLLLVAFLFAGIFTSACAPDRSGEGRPLDHARADNNDRLDDEGALLPVLDDRTEATDAQVRSATLERQTLEPAADTPEEHFIRAEQALSEEDYDLAARELRKAVVSTKRESVRAEGELTRPLRKTQRALNQLADEIEIGRLDESGRFERLVSGATLALGEAHLSHARRALKDGRTETAARALDDSVAYLERSTVWAGLEPAPATQSALREARSLARIVLTHGEWTRSDLSSAMARVEAASNELHEQMDALPPLLGEIAKRG